MSIKGDKTQRLNILISESLDQRLAEASEKYDTSKSAFVRQAVERELQRREEEELAQAADELASLYASDDKLIAFTDLDSEDFS